MASTNTIRDNKCTIVGMLEDGVNSLNQHALDRLKSADVVIGTPRFLGAVQSLLKNTAEIKDFSGQLMKVPEWIDAELLENKQVVVVATGDPLCHGIGSFLNKKLGADKLHIIPNVGMFQVAFSRLGIPWQSVKISSVHAKDMGEWTEATSLNRAAHGMFSLLKDCQNQDLIACYTSPENSASRIASMLKVEDMKDEFELLIASH
ncbi:MAG: precorrin-6y C5,15-methyltransferase (decarboxylating) subunit CbiE, partial [Thiothrix sp.]